MRWHGSKRGDRTSPRQGRPTRPPPPLKPSSPRAGAPVTAREFVDRLEPGDRFGVAVFSTSAEVVQRLGEPSGRPAASDLIARMNDSRLKFGGGTAPSPLPAAADFRKFADELFLVQALIDDPTLERAATTRWPALEAPAREREAKRVACELKWFWEGLREAGLHYGDLSARNVLVAPGGATRVVDAGCAVPAASRVVLREFTPAFLTPRLYAAAAAGEPVPGDLSSVLPAVAKILHFALTLAQPLNGAPPDLAAPALAAYSPACRRALASMAEVDGDGERVERALADLAAWVGW
ncbi:MAG TPA: hypothetical protein VFS43_21475 [Polyangiaceae bacterium]|nr:hypothetical protein [Polyangiaceae bacterium]